jgi:hypothetical protein
MRHIKGEGRDIVGDGDGHMAVDVFVFAFAVYTKNQQPTTDNNAVRQTLCPWVACTWPYL